MRCFDGSEQQRRDPHTARAQRARGRCAIVHLKPRAQRARRCSKKFWQFVTSAPWVTGSLPHHGYHCIVAPWETHLLFTGHSAIDASDTSAHRAWSERWPASLKGRIKSEPRGPSQLRGVRGVSTNRTAPITNRHGSSWFESFHPHFALFWTFWLAIFELGCTEK